jgi:hypothetical protein
MHVDDSTLRLAHLFQKNPGRAPENHAQILAVRRHRLNRRSQPRCSVRHTAARAFRPALPKNRPAHWPTRIMHFDRSAARPSSIAHARPNVNQAKGSMPFRGSELQLRHKQTRAERRSDARLNPQHVFLEGLDFSRSPGTSRVLARLGPPFDPSPCNPSAPC